MAQNTYGIKVGYGALTSGALPTSWTTFFPDIKEYPDLNGSVSDLETTDLSSSSKTYIAGLTDVGGTLEFNANLTPDLITAVESAIDLQEADDDGLCGFCVEFPAPLSKRYVFKGIVQPVRPSGAGTDAVVETTVMITPASAITEQTVS